MTVLEAVHVNGLIGVPVTNADLIAAWLAAPGTNAGVMPLRLPSLLMPAEATGPAFDPRAAATLARARDDAAANTTDGGVLQPGLVAAVSAIRYEAVEGHAAQLSITVAFN